MRQHPKRRYLWLFAALLPCVLFGVIREKNSWRPHGLQVGPGMYVYPIGWLSDNQGISLGIRVHDTGTLKYNQIWDWRKRKLLQTQKPSDKWGNGYFFSSAKGLCPYYLPQSHLLQLSNGSSYFLGEAELAIFLDSYFIGYRLFQKNNLQKLEVTKWDTTTGRSFS